MLAESTEIATYSTATRIAEGYQRHTGRIAELLRELAQEVKQLQEVFQQEACYTSDFGFGIYRNYNDRIDLDQKGICELLLKMKRAAWSVLIEKLSIKKLMSAKDREKLEKQLSGDRPAYGEKPLPELPDIDADTITAVLQGFVSSAPEYFASQVQEVYRWLIPSSWEGGHVTNFRDRIGKKVIRTWTVERGYGNQSFHVRYNRRGEVNSLDTVFHTLDGKGPIQGHEGPLVSAIATSEEGIGETEYCKFKCCKNGNLHIEFKRIDLLEQFNRMAADSSRVGAKRK